MLALPSIAKSGKKISSASLYFLLINIQTLPHVGIEKNTTASQAVVEQSSVQCQYPDGIVRNKSSNNRNNFTPNTSFTKPHCSHLTSIDKQQIALHDLSVLDDSLKAAENVFNFNTPTEKSYIEPTTKNDVNATEIKTYEQFFGPAPGQWKDFVNENNATEFMRPNSNPDILNLAVVEMDVDDLNETIVQSGVTEEPDDILETLAVGMYVPDSISYNIRTQELDSEFRNLEELLHMVREKQLALEKQIMQTRERNKQ